MLEVWKGVLYFIRPWNAGVLLRSPAKLSCHGGQTSLDIPRRLIHSYDNQRPCRRVPCLCLRPIILCYTQTSKRQCSSYPTLRWQSADLLSALEQRFSRKLGLKLASRTMPYYAMLFALDPQQEANQHNAPFSQCLGLSLCRFELQDMEQVRCAAYGAGGQAPQSPPGRGPVKDI